MELFNRPSPIARDQAVMLMLAHSFEMLLKAIIFQARGTIRDKGDAYTYKLGRCINIAHSDLKVLEPDHLPIVWAIKQDRNASAHDSVAFSEDMLWLHVRSAVSIFGELLDKAFGEDLKKVITARAVPVNAAPPTDASAVIEREMRDIAEMLGPGLRRADDAKARIRPLLALDGSVTGREEAPMEAELDRAVAAFRKGQAWQTVFPGLASLEITQIPGGSTQEVTLRIAKAGKGPAVRSAKPGEEESALIYRKSSTFDEYSVKLTEFGPKLGLSINEGYALAYHLRLKDDPDCYFLKLTKNGNIQHQGFSAKAFDLGRKEIAKPNFKTNLPKMVATYKNRPR